MSRKRVLRPAFLNLGLKLGSTGLSLAVQVILARMLDVTGYGRYTYVIVLAGGLATVAAMGWPLALMRYIAEYCERKDYSLVRGIIWQALKSSLGLAGLIMLGLLGAGLVVSDMRLEFWFTAAIVPFQLLALVCGRALRGLHRNIWAVLPEDVLLPSFLTLLILLFGVRQASSALWLHLAVSSSVALTAMFVLTRSVPQGTREYRSKVWLHSALFMGSAGLAQFLISRSPLVFLGLVAQPEDVGLYGACMRYSNLLALVLAAMNITLVPLLASSYNNGRFQEFHRAIRLGTILSSACALPGAAILMLAPEWCLSFLGPNYVAGAPLLRVLTLGQFVNAASGPVCAAVVMSKREALFARLAWTIATLSVVASLGLIPIYGAMAAAWVCSAGNSLINIACLVIVKTNIATREIPPMAQP